MNLKEKVTEILNVPRKAIEGDENRTLEPELGAFLVENGYIKGIEEQKHGWGFIYSSSTRKIYTSEKWMPKEKWKHCIFRVGINEEVGESFYPEPGEETKKYRFLHEVNHAYQEYLFSRESVDDPKLWHERSLQGKIDSCFSDLFNFCFQKRDNFPKRGLSIWGSAPQYDRHKDKSIINKMSEIAVRAQEDANELVTMYIWHPKYFHTFLDYLENSKEEDLKKECLLGLQKEEADYLKVVVKRYVEEMKLNLTK